MFAYHAVPAQLRGNSIYPLFELEHRFPELHAMQIKKYDDHPERRKLPTKEVPLLRCRRGDVVHCSPIDPRLIFQALRQVFPDFTRSCLFFKIEVARLSARPLALFDMNRPGYVFGQEDPENLFERIDPRDYSELTTVPEPAYDFYRSWRDRGMSSAPAWGKIPHLFVQGSFDIAGCEQLDWAANP